MVPHRRVAALSSLALCSQRLQTALLVSVPGGFPFLGFMYISHGNLGPVGAGHSLFISCYLHIQEDGALVSVSECLIQGILDK